MKINVHAAKTHFSKLIERVLLGEEVTIARAGRPVARLVRATPRPTRRVPGSAAGRVQIADDFDAPLPEDLLKEFAG